MGDREIRNEAGLARSNTVPALEPNSVMNWSFARGCHRLQMDLTQTGFFADERRDTQPKSNFKVNFSVTSYKRLYTKIPNISLPFISHIFSKFANMNYSLIVGW